MQTMKQRLSLGLLAALGLLAGCGSIPPAGADAVETPACTAPSASAAPDYDKIENWFCRSEPLKLADTLLLGCDAHMRDALTASFARASNVYAPRVADEDALFAALDWYFRNVNGSRPFAIADFSVDAAQLRCALTSYRARHPDAFEPLVAAYVPTLDGQEAAFAAQAGLTLAAHGDDTRALVIWQAQDAPEDIGADLARRVEAFFERD